VQARSEKEAATAASIQINDLLPGAQ